MECLSSDLRQFMTDRLKALGDEARFRLVMALNEGERNVTSLVNELGIAQASVSKHLAVLKRHGIVKVRREGNQSFYRIHDPSVIEIYHMACESVKRDHAERLDALNGRINYQI